jgi:hypothetical protein
LNLSSYTIIDTTIETPIYEHRYFIPFVLVLWNLCLTIAILYLGNFHKLILAWLFCKPCRVNAFDFTEVSVMSMCLELVCFSLILIILIVIFVRVKRLEYFFKNIHSLDKTKSIKTSTSSKATSTDNSESLPDFNHVYCQTSNTSTSNTSDDLSKSISYSYLDEYKVYL